MPCWGQDVWICVCWPSYHHLIFSLRIFSNKTAYKIPKNIQMENINKLPAKVRSINTAIRYYSFNEMRKKFGRKDDAFMVVDSSEIEFSSSMIPAKADNAAML